MTPGTNQPRSGFSIDEMKCPSCGGPIAFSGTSGIITCQFCGSTVHISVPEQETGIESDGTVRDKATGYGLFRMRTMPGWHVVSTTLQRMGTSSRPFVPRVELSDNRGGIVQMRMGEAGARNSAGLNALMAMYGGHLSGIDTANYADMPNPITVADRIAGDIASAWGASQFMFARQLAHPNLQAECQKALARYQRAAQVQGAQVAQPFAAVVLRTYDLTCNGEPWKLAVYVLVDAAKDGMGVGDGFGAGMMGGLGGLMDSIGSLFGGTKNAAPAGGMQPGGWQGQQQAYPTQSQQGGVMDFFMGGGLVGKMKRNQQPPAQMPYAQQGMTQSQPMPYAQQTPYPQQGFQQATNQVPVQSVAWSTSDFAQYTSSGTIYWSVSTVVTFIAPADDFDAQFESAFVPFASTLEVHPDVESLSLSAIQQEAAQIQSATQSQLSRNQAAFQAQQAAHRQTQAAFDSYNQSISDARNAHHQQFRAATNAQFDTPASGRAPDYSEAIRGVNTYVTSDGREVEISVQADRAFENQAGDVIGTSNTFDPGGSWTEIPRT